MQNKSLNRIFSLTPDDRRAIVSFIVCAAFLVIIAFVQPGIFQFSRVGVITNAQMALIFAGIGQTLVLLIGGIDLSIGGVICLTNSIAALYMHDSVGGAILMFLVCIMIGFAVGAFNGFIVTKFKVQPFVVTFTVNYILLGIALYILPIDGGDVPKVFIDGLINKIGGVIPVSLIIIVGIVGAWVYLRRSRCVRDIYAVGSNIKACVTLGIKVNRVRILTYATAGLMAGLAGYWRTAQMTSGSSVAGDALTMQTLTIAVIGGTSMAGGKGGIIGTIIGAVILRVMSDLLTFAQAKSYWSTIFSGLFLIITVVVCAVIELKGRANND